MAPFCSHYTRFAAGSTSPLDVLLTHGGGGGGIGVRAGPPQQLPREADAGAAAMQHQHPWSKSGRIVVEIFRPNAPLFLRSERLFPSGP